MSNWMSTLTGVGPTYPPDSTTPENRLTQRVALAMAVRQSFVGEDWEPSAAGKRIIRRTERIVNQCMERLESLIVPVDVPKLSASKAKRALAESAVTTHDDTDS